MTNEDEFNIECALNCAQELGYYAGYEAAQANYRRAFAEQVKTIDTATNTVHLEMIRLRHLAVTILRNSGVQP